MLSLRPIHRAPLELCHPATTRNLSEISLEIKLW